MPELPVKEVRLPELHFPEIDRDQIVSSLSGLRLPTVEITTIERPRFGRTTGSRRFGLPAIDLGPAVAGVAALGRLGARARPLVRTRWVVAVGAVVVVGLATAALVATPAVRERAGRTVRDVRARIDTATKGERLEIDADLADAGADGDTVTEDVVVATDAAVETVETVVPTPRRRSSPRPDRDRRRSQAGRRPRRSRASRSSPPNWRRPVSVTTTPTNRPRRLAAVRQKSTAT